MYFKIITDCSHTFFCVSSLHSVIYCHFGDASQIDVWCFHPHFLQPLEMNFDWHVSMLYAVKAPLTNSQISTMFVQSVAYGYPIHSTHICFHLTGMTTSWVTDMKTLIVPRKNKQVKPILFHSDQILSLYQLYFRMHFQPKIRKNAPQPIKPFFFAFCQKKAGCKMVNLDNETNFHNNVPRYQFSMYSRKCFKNYVKWHKNRYILQGLSSISF